MNYQPKPCNPGRPRSPGIHPSAFTQMPTPELIDRHSRTLDDAHVPSLRRHGERLADLLLLRAEAGDPAAVEWLIPRDEH